MTEESAKVIFFVATEFVLRYLESSFGPDMGIPTFLSPRHNTSIAPPLLESMIYLQPATVTAASVRMTAQMVRIRFNCLAGTGSLS